jgi:3-deoxy-D-arabino-heptulosonate 7-phosphate (DAHP) synthase
MTKTLIVADTIERARNYARQHGYQNADIVGGDIKQLRGRHAKLIIIVGEVDEHVEQVIAPIKSAGAEVLRGD